MSSVSSRVMQSGFSSKVVEGHKMCPNVNEANSTANGLLLVHTDLAISVPEERAHYLERWRGFQKRQQGQQIFPAGL